MKLVGYIFLVIFATVNSEDIECEGENEQFFTCASYCPKTCQSICKTPVKCIELCQQKCDCKSGFIRDEISSKCINPSKCPKCKCPQNEVWTACNGQCEKTCSSMKNPETCAPEDSCSPGCICAKGSIRNEKTGKCVSPGRCPK